MKHLSSFCSWLGSSLAMLMLVAVGLPVQAQTEAARQAAELVLQTRAQWAGADIPAANFRISSAYTEASGLLYAYPQQLQGGIPVYNQVVTIVFKNGHLAHHAGSFLSPKVFAGQSATPTVVAAAAVATALASTKTKAAEQPSATSAASGIEQQQTFSPAGVARRPIEVRLVWATDTGMPRLAWNVNVDLLATPDWLNIRVDAATGQVLGQDNWTVKEKGTHPMTAAASVPRRAVARPATQPLARPQSTLAAPKSILAVTPASYIVVPFPGERPDVTTPTTDTNPWLRAGTANNATTYGWHYDGTTDYTITRGNNVAAYDDAANTNNPGNYASSQTTSPLSFPYAASFTTAPNTVANRNAAVTNLFYWNNLMHDVMYQYGFTELTGNFQASNLSRGGLGNDYVKAEAQDGGGTNNANFSTPVDGQSGRMQMYLFNFTTPNRDGDFDSGVITHEYGHGISNRLTGGPLNSSCLGNAEEAGEGWSDYFGLMMTTDWTTAQLTDGAKARPIGTYVLGQSPTAAGIRRYPYSTSLSINPLTYADVAVNTEVHNIGEVWCATLWDLTWALIQQQSTIEPNLYNSVSTGGNAIALNLVMQGLKMQPCQPGFLNSRDAILAADNLLYNGQYDCLIKNVFARRGMGASAVQGLSTSATDQVAAFDGSLTLRKYTTPSIGNQFIISLEATNGCVTSPQTFTLTDKLPADLQYLSSTGGTLGSNNTVTFANLTFAAGQTRTFQIQAQTAPGKGCAATTPVNDDRDANTAGGLTPAVRTGTNAWAASTLSPYSGATSWRAPDIGSTSDATLTSAAFTPASFSVLSFQHYFNTEYGWDGGLVALSTDGGTTWIDAAPYFVQNGYQSRFYNVTSPGLVSPGRPCFSGSTSAVAGAAAYIQTIVDLSSFSGQSVRVRFQFQTDVSNDPGTFNGWFLDDIKVVSGCGDYQRVQLAANSDASIQGLYITPTFLTPLPAPTIISFTPINGPVGTVVTITGTNLSGATGVTFNGVAAITFASTSPTTVTATVPAGATTGLITVTTPSGTATSATSFTVTVPVPVTAAPVVNTPANGSTINTRTPTYTGTAPATSTVTVYVNSASVGTTTATAGGTFSLVQPTSLADGSYTVRATAQLIGQAVSASSNTNTFTIDATAPTITAFSSTAGASGSNTSTTPFAFSVTFSESVTGFSASGITVTNGSVTTSPTGSGSGPYAFSVTPTTAGTATTVTIAANAAQDGAGNGNTASAPYSLTYTAPVATATTWTGNVSTDWFLPGNWTAGVPTISVDATIPTGAPRYPLIGTGAAAARALALNSGAALTQTGGTLDVRGNLTNNGTASFTGGTVSLGQTALASILGSSSSRFWNLTVGASGTQLGTSAATAVQRVLTLSGSLATQGNSFTLLSGSTGDALVVNSGGVVTGNATVQRYIDPSLNAGPGYRHYSAPVSTTTVADLGTSGFAPVLNTAYNTAATPNAVTPFPTVFGYDEGRVPTVNSLNPFDRGYFSPAAPSTPLTPGRGYTVNIGGSQLVDFVGTLTTGDLTLALTNNRAANAAAGWHLLGNPYPAPLDYHLVLATDRPNLEAAMYVYSSTSQYGGQYRAYTNGLGNPVIPSGQGFFVRTQNNAAAGALNFHNYQRLLVPEGTAFQRTTAETRALVQLTLHGAGSVLTDEAYVYFQAGATAGLDVEYDAVKLANPTGPNLAALANGQEMAITGLPLLGAASLTVPLAVHVPAPGTYTLAAAQLLNLSAQYVYLRDVQLGTLTDLQGQPTYTFTLNATNAGARFELVFSPQRPLAAGAASLAQQVGVYPNPAHTAVAIELPASLSRQPVTAALVDALGRTVRTQVLPAGGATHALPLTGVAAGVYALRLSTEAGLVIKKLVVE